MMHVHMTMSNNKNPADVTLLTVHAAGAVVQSSRLAALVASIGGKLNKGH